MKKLLKFIRSIFSKNKYSVYVDCIDKDIAVYYTIVNHVRLANMHSYKHIFSIIPLSNNIIIKCQTYNDISCWSTLSLSLLRCYQEEELADRIDKELKCLTNEVDSSYNCYKASKNEKDN
jgi:hypothetical protein|nr:MAG TPA_asm: hypothetical protein [Bacteriophage sp.]